MRHPGTSLPRLRCRARPVNKKAKLCQTAKSLPTSGRPVDSTDRKNGPGGDMDLATVLAATVDDRECLASGKW